MAHPEKYHLAEASEEFDLQGNKPELDADGAEFIVRNLGARGYVRVGGVLPGERFGDHSDAKVIAKELAIIQANYDPESTDFVTGPHVMGMTDDSDGVYYPRGVMLFVKSCEKAAPDSI